MKPVLKEADISAILQIPVSVYSTPNRFLWNGIFSGKSAYHLHMSLRTTNQGQSSNKESLMLAGNRYGLCPVLML